MKTKSGFCRKKFRTPCGNKFKCVGLPDVMFCKHKPDALNKFYKGIYKNSALHCKKHTKTLIDSIDANIPYGDNKEDTIDTIITIGKVDTVDTVDKADTADTTQTIDTLPVTGDNIFGCDANISSDDIKMDSVDIIPVCTCGIGSYLSRHGMANSQIQAIMRLDGRLDFDKLKRAVRLSIDAQPVLGCRYVEDDPPYWNRLDNIDETDFCSMEETDKTDEAVTGFLQGAFDLDNNPMVKVKMIRSKQNDILGIKVNQVCCDGTGVKEYIKLLSDIYSDIDGEDGTFIPEPGTDGIEDRDRLSEELGATCPEIEWNPPLKTPKTRRAFPWVQKDEDSVGFAVCRLPKGSLRSIHKYGESRGATVNDLILTSFYRAMFKITRPSDGAPMDIPSTIDLRRYLPGYKVRMTNLCGGFISRITAKTDEPFDSTLSRVIPVMKKVKDRRGINRVVGEERMEKTGFAFSHNYFELVSKTSCFPGLSNLGCISRSPIIFGENTVTDAYLIPPVMREPGFLVLASSYNGVLTLSTSCYKASIGHRDMEDLLDKIKVELMRDC